MKRFIKKLLLLVLSYAIIVAVVNFYIDSSNAFSFGREERKAAEIVLKGHNVDNIGNFDERYFLENVMKGVARKPDVMVIGTSRSLEISADFFPGKLFYNCSVSHANMNDFIGLIGLLDSLNKLPEELYIETSPTLINPSLTREWQSLYPYYEYALGKMQLLNVAAESPSLYATLNDKLQALFSFDYLQENILAVLHKHTKEMKDVGNAIPANYGRLSDCSITYSLSYRTPDTVKAMANASVYLTKNFIPSIEYKYLNTLEILIDYLSKKNIKITLFNLPFQHDCFNLIEANNATFNNIKQGIEEFTKRVNKPLIGTFNPYQINLRRNQFYDPLHCDKAALRLALAIKN